MFGQDSEVVAVERLRLIAGIGVPNGLRKVTDCAKRARILALRCIPIQPVLLTRVTHELLGVLLYAVAIVCLAEILLLSVSSGHARRNRSQLAFANSTRKDLILPGCRVERPLPRGILNQRNWKRIVVGAHIQDLAACFDFSPPIHLAVGSNKILKPILVLHGISREEHVIAIGAKDREQGLLVARLGGVKKSRARFRRSCEGSLSWLGVC